MTYQALFGLLMASLFKYKDVDLPNWKPVFEEMKVQSVAGLPGEWLKTNLSTAKLWLNYCVQIQCRWIRVMHGQDQLISLLEANSIPSVIIKGAAAAQYYPHPTLRSMGDVDFLVKRCDFERAANLLETSGYALSNEKRSDHHHYGYSKDTISFELHKRLGIISDADEEMLTLFEKGIDQREWKTIEGYRFPVLPWNLNGLVLIFHINQHLRSGLGLRQIIDWMMYVNQLSCDQWNELLPLLKQTGMEKLAFTVTVMCQRYLGLRTIVNEDETLPVDELLSYIMEKGNFGRKAGVDGKTASFSLTSVGFSGFFRRLQKGGVSHWKAAKKYRFLRPFAWIYQSFRILGIFLKNKITPKEVLAQQEKGRKQRQLIEALGLDIDRTIRFDG